MSNPSRLPGPSATAAERADFAAAVEQLIAAVHAGQLAAVSPPVRCRPPLERIGPSPVYQELEYWLGYRTPSGYRAVPSTPADFDPPRAAGPVA
jgi:hypothetical protein